MAAILDPGSISDFATGTGTSVVVDAPTGITAGDLILVHISSESGISLSGLASGFSSMLALDEYGGMVGFVAAKVATGSEPSSYTFTLSNSSTSWGAWSELVDGADLSSFPTSAVVGTAVAGNNGANVTVGGLTLAAGDLLIGHVASRGTGATISSNGSVMTPILATQTLGSRTTRGFHESPAAGATGTRQFNVTASTFHTAGLLGIRAAVVAPTYTGDLDAAAGNASADFAGAYAPPEYIGAIDASSGASTATFAGTYNAPGYSGGLTATSGGSSGAFAGAYTVPEYDGDLSAASGVASVSFSGSYTAPGSAGSLSAASQPAAASFSGTYAVPEYEGALSADAGASSTSFSGDYTPPPGGVLQIVSGPASAAFAGSYAVPAYAGEMAGLAGSADAAFAGSYAVPTYGGALAALSGPATASFTEFSPPVAHYLTGRLTVRPALTGSLAVQPTLTGTLTVRPG